MRLIIVSGRSGSGKSTALDVLEDNGFYCIDNLPAGLLPDLAERALLQTELLHPQVAVSVDARNLPASSSVFPSCSTRCAPAISRATYCISMPTRRPCSSASPRPAGATR